MSDVRRLVLDLLKPSEVETEEFPRAIADLDGVAGANATLLERDRHVENLKLTIEGPGIDSDRVRAAIEGLGGTLHSVDEVVCGERLVEESYTKQDRP
jgi:hypothetical protein